mmetsp:Transcript_4067/g.5430  ORF Transcript_4067/g.5430 Transcript_4067/m.5430 type:complete len:390 (+) Transcript_4067:52-1221(+)
MHSILNLPPNPLQRNRVACAVFHKALRRDDFHTRRFIQVSFEKETVAKVQVKYPKRHFFAPLVTLQGNDFGTCGLRRFHVVPHDSINPASSDENELPIRVSNLGVLLTKETEKLLRRKDSLATEKSRNLERDKVFAEAELLIAYQAFIPSYSELAKPVCRIQVESYSSPGEYVSLTLATDKFSNPIEEAEEKFKLCRKMKRGLVRIEEALEKVDRNLTQIKSLHHKLQEHYADLAILDSIENEIFTLLGQKRNRKQAQKPKSAASKIYKLYHGPDGTKIMVGRNASRNDTLTFKVAKTKDLWLHAKHCSGTHVIVKVKDKDVPSKETLQMAANLSALHSRNKTMAEVPVIVTERKYISKPSGAKPGAVVVKKERTLIGIPSKAMSYRFE